MPKRVSVHHTDQIPTEESSIIGRPGYRNRPGRSGLDPMDTYNEQGFIEGLLIRNLLTGRFLTRNPFVLVLMALLGIVCLTPEILALVYHPNDGGAISICYGPIMAAIGLGLLSNVIKSLVSRESGPGMRGL
jgi:hypothetical protein